MSEKLVLTIRLSDSENGSWVDGMSAEQAWEAGKQWWVLKGSRAINCELVMILNPECRVVAVKDLMGLKKKSRDGGCYAIIGTDTNQEDKKYLGALALRGRSQNPIAYLDRSDFRFKDEAES